MRMSFKFCIGSGNLTADQVAAKMLELADTTCKPERLMFKGNPTDVYLYKMTLKDSIWFMW